MSASGEKRRNKDGGRNDWQTPPELFKLLDAEFQFDLDMAASKENALKPWYYTEDDDAFQKAACLCDVRAFCNPPYGRGLPDWIQLFDTARRCESSLIVALLPAAPDTAWWRYAHDISSEIRLLSGRVKFINPTTGKPDGSNTTGSTVFIIDQSTRPKRIRLWDWRAEL